MDYNNYYLTQSGHPPPVTNQQPQQRPQPTPPGQMMHTQMPTQSIRHSPLNHHQQIQQQQQHLAHHSQHMPSQQQQHHQSYHHIQHPHVQPVSHSGSPHSQQQHHSLQSSPTQQQPAIAPQQQQQHHLHSQSPHHHAGPMHVQQQQPQLNSMVRPPMGPSVMNHSSNLQHTSNHQTFYNTAPSPQANLHHYPQQNQHHPSPHSHQTQHLQQHPHQHHQSPTIHHVSPAATHHPHVQQTIGRSSPYHPSILQTELRIIELNRRLQLRPVTRHPVSPLPSHHDDSLWWERFASEFFDDDATLTLRIFDDKPLEYTIGRTLIPRFFRTYFDGGVTDLSINLRNPKEATPNPHLITLNCDQALIITNNIFRGPHIPPTNQGVIVHTEGSLILEFVSSSIDTLLIKSWKFYTKGCREYIDRSVTALGLPNTLLVEPVTRQGLTKSTISYLKMCMIMEPMQDLMFQNRQTKLQPKVCLTRLLYDRYKFSSTEDTRTVTTKRNRKRKSTAAAGMTGMPTTTKKSKVNASTIGNNTVLNNNIMMSPSGQPNFPLVSQDVMVVGEPSMMGGDFGDDNERTKTRLENTQYDPSASTPSIAEESDSMNTSTGNDNVSSNSNNIDSSVENHTSSPSLLQRQQQQVQQTVQALPQQNRVEHNPSPTEDRQTNSSQHRQLNQQRVSTANREILQGDSSNSSNQVNLVDQVEHLKQVPDNVNQLKQSVAVETQSDLSKEENPNENGKLADKEDDSRVNSALETRLEASASLQTTSVDQVDIQPYLNQIPKEEPTYGSQPASGSTVLPNNYKNQSIEIAASTQNETVNNSTSETTLSAAFGTTEENHSLQNDDKSKLQTPDDLVRQTSEEPIEKENKSFVTIEETNRNSTATQSENHYNIMNSIPEDREDTCRPTSCDTVTTKLPPISNSKNALTTNGSSNKQNRRRSSERKEIMKEGLMRTYDFVVALKDLKCENPVLWRITNNSLLQQFAPKVQNGVVLYENTHSFAGWNPEISKNFMGVDVKLTQHNRSQITVERLFLNFQKLEDSTSFFDRHYMVYFQIIMSTVLDPLFWDGIENEPEHHDYFLTSRRIIEDITKRFKLKLSSKLKLSDSSLKNFEKYPNLLIKALGKSENQPCRACNTSESTQVVSFGNRSYDLRSYQPVKVTCELSKTDEKDMHNNLCDMCLELVKLYSDIHHMGWRLYNLAREKVDQQRVEGKPINSILDECLKDEDWLSSIYAERDKLWTAIEHIQ